MNEITLDNADFDLYAHTLQAMYWYGSLSSHSRQAYVDSISMYHATTLQRMITSILMYNQELFANQLSFEFDVNVVRDLSIRLDERARLEKWNLE